VANAVSSQPRLTGKHALKLRSLFDLEKTMANEKPKEDEFSAVGKRTMARAYSAMDYYFDDLKKTDASAPTAGTELGEKVKACAEQNISAAQEFVRDLSYAKDIQDMLRIQMEFMRTQMDAFGEQAKDLSERRYPVKRRQSTGESRTRFIKSSLIVMAVS
jgi:hypothetical protein